MQNAASSDGSPTNGLLLGLVITLAAVLAYASYTTMQLAGLRRLQSEMVDRNRKDSLQLLRVQNDLNSIALAMRDMLDTTESYPLTAWTAQFERIHQDLDAGLKLEESLAGANRTPEQRLFLSQAVAQFWDAVNRMFGVAQNGKEAEAREQIRLSLQARQQALSTAVSRLLVENNEGEEQAAARIAQIYDGVQRQLYTFLGATLIAIVLTSLYLIRSNRQIFARLAELSEQRSDLAQWPEDPAALIEALQEHAVAPLLYARRAGLNPLAASGFVPLGARRTILVLLASLGSLWPMYGLSIAFQDYLPFLGYSGIEQ